MPPAKKQTTPSKLTPKQERFCLEYVVDLNATQAAIRAGYSAKTAGQTANEYLKKPEIKKQIARLQAEISKRVEITADMVVRELAAIGFADFRECFDDAGNLLSPKKMPAEIAKAVAGVDVIDVKNDVRVKKLKLWNKVQALENLAKHLGMFQQDGGGATAINVNVIDTPRPGGNDARD